MTCDYGAGLGQRQPHRLTALGEPRGCCAGGVMGLGFPPKTCILPEFHYPEETCGDAR